jgi:hypothetical protein
MLRLNIEFESPRLNGGYKILFQVAFPKAKRPLLAAINTLLTINISADFDLLALTGFRASRPRLLTAK